MAKRKNIDCPFTQEEIAIFHDMLYQVNAGNKCINPMHFCWVKGVMEVQEMALNNGGELTTNKED